MYDILDTIKYLVNKEVEERVFTGNVSSLNPLQVKLTSSDNPINVRMVNVFGIKVGSNVLMIKDLNKFVIIGVLGNIAQSFCLLKRTTTQSIPATTNTPIDFSSGSVIVDPESMFDGNDKITIPADGLYQINCAYRWQDSTASTTRITEVHLNGVKIHSVAASPDGAGRYGVNISLNLDLIKDQYIQIMLFTGTSLSIGAYDNTYFNVIPLNAGSALAINQDANQTKCSMIKDSAQTIPTGNPATKITFGSGDVDYDPLNMFNDANDRIIVPSAGLYEIIMTGRWENEAGDNDRIFYAYINGDEECSVVSNVGSSGRAGNCLTIKKYLYVNDYIEMFVYQDSGGNVDIGGSGFYKLYFSVEKCV